MTDDFLGGVKGEGFRGVEAVEEAPVDDGGSEGEIGDDGGEIGGGAGESGVEGEGDAGVDAAALECVAGGDDYGIRHEISGERAEELGRNLDLLERRGGFVEGNLPALLAAPHCCQKKWRERTRRLMEREIEGLMREIRERIEGKGMKK